MRRQTRVMHTWKFGDSTQFVWTPGSDPRGFQQLVRREHNGFTAIDVAVGYMRVENLYSVALGRYVPSTIIAEDGEGDQVVYGKRVLDRQAAYA